MAQSNAKPLSLGLWVLESFSFWRPVARFVREYFRTYGGTFSHLLGALHYDPVSGFEAAFNNPIGSDLIAHFDDLDMHCIRDSNDGDLVGTLKLRHRALRHKECILFRLCLRAHLTVLPWAQQKTRVWKYPDDLKSTGV